MFDIIIAASYRILAVTLSTLMLLSGNVLKLLLISEDKSPIKFQMNIIIHLSQFLQTY